AQEEEHHVEQVVDRRDLRQPERGQCQRPLDDESQRHREQQRGDEGEDVYRRRAAEVSIEDDADDDRGRDDADQPEHLEAQVLADVVVNRVDRTQEQGREGAGADAPLELPHVPDERHVADDQHHDEVGGVLVRREPASLAVRPRDGPPDDERHQRLHDRREDPDRRRAAIGDVERDVDRELAAVILQQGTPGCPLTPPHAHAVTAFSETGFASLSKTFSITSSNGGSSMLRSATGSSARRRPASRAVSDFGTVSVNPASERETIDASAGSMAWSRSSGTGSPSSNSTTIVFCGANSRARPARSPS